MCYPLHRELCYELLTEEDLKIEGVRVEKRVSEEGKSTQKPEKGASNETLADARWSVEAKKQNPKKVGSEELLL
jgi:hypothetical protein